MASDTSGALESARLLTPPSSEARRLLLSWHNPRLRRACASVACACTGVLLLAAVALVPRHDTSRHIAVAVEEGLLLHGEDWADGGNAGACPGDSVPQGCSEHGEPDSDCCAKSGTAGCVDGTPPVEGTKCGGGYAVVTCCPRPEPVCPAQFIKIGCFENGKADPDCCALAGTANCQLALTGTLLDATVGKICHENGAVTTCCPTPRQAVSNDTTLFCFFVAMNNGGESALARSHHQQGKSIFACEAWSVVSDGALDPIPVLNIGALKSSWGYWGSWVNTGVFIRAWDAVINEGKWVHHGWSVKVDPDTVFFPERLKWHIGALKVHSTDTVYVRNPGRIFLGPIEVLSLGAVKKMFFKRKEVCTFKLQGSPEDVWMGWCLDALGCWKKEDKDLLSNNLRRPDPNGFCHNGWVVAFHAFKEVGPWLNCWNRAVTK